MAWLYLVLTLDWLNPNKLALMKSAPFTSQPLSLKNGPEPKPEPTYSHQGIIETRVYRLKALCFMRNASTAATDSGRKFSTPS